MGKKEEQIGTKVRFVGSVAQRRLIGFTSDVER
jgi:hypothetical protein